jgi:hypothetical protein
MREHPGDQNGEKSRLSDAALLEAGGVDAQGGGISGAGAKVAADKSVAAPHRKRRIDCRFQIRLSRGKQVKLLSRRCCY